MSIEVVSTLQRKVNLNISKAVVNDQVAQELKKYAKQAKVQGFRPGKAPQHIVEQMYGGRAYEDALNQQLNQHFSDQVLEHKFNIVGYPSFDLTSSEGDAFVFAATFEVMPEVVIGDLAIKEIEKPQCNLTEANIDTTIDVLRKQRASYEISTATAADEDKVTIDFTGKIDGSEFDGGQAQDYVFIVGQGRMLPDFEAGVRGMHTGESKEVMVEFPSNYHAEDLRGKTAVFIIELKEVAKQCLPELTPEFIQGLGVKDGNLESLRREIKDNLQLEVDRRLKIKARDNALQALSEVSPVELPTALIDDEIQNMLQKTSENLKKQGQKAEQIKLEPEMFAKDAKIMVALRLIVQAFIQLNKISATDEDVKKVVADMAALYEDPIDYVTWYFKDKDRVNNAHAIAMEQKVTDAIFAQAQVKEVDMAYEEIMKMQLSY